MKLYAFGLLLLLLVLVVNCFKLDAAEANEAQNHREKRQTQQEHTHQEGHDGHDNHHQDQQQRHHNHHDDGGHPQEVVVRLDENCRRISPERVQVNFEDENGRRRSHELLIVIEKEDGSGPVHRDFGNNGQGGPASNPSYGQGRGRDHTYQGGPGGPPPPPPPPVAYNGGTGGGEAFQSTLVNRNVYVTDEEINRGGHTHVVQDRIYADGGREMAREGGIGGGGGYVQGGTQTAVVVNHSAEGQGQDASRSDGQGGPASNPGYGQGQERDQHGHDHTYQEGPGQAGPGGPPPPPPPVAYNGGAGGGEGYQSTLASRNNVYVTDEEINRGGHTHVVQDRIYADGGVGYVQGGTQTNVVVNHSAAHPEGQGHQDASRNDRQESTGKEGRNGTNVAKEGSKRKRKKKGRRSRGPGGGSKRRRECSEKDNAKEGNGTKPGCGSRRKRTRTQQGEEGSGSSRRQRKKRRRYRGGGSSSRNTTGGDTTAAGPGAGSQSAGSNGRTHLVQDRIYADGGKEIVRDGASGGVGGGGGGYVSGTQNTVVVDHATHSNGQHSPARAGDGNEERRSAETYGGAERNEGSDGKRQRVDRRSRRQGGGSSKKRRRECAEKDANKEGNGTKPECGSSGKKRTRKRQRNGKEGEEGSGRRQRKKRRRYSASNDTTLASSAGSGRSTSKRRRTGSKEGGKERTERREDTESRKEIHREHYSARNAEKVIIVQKVDGVEYKYEVTLRPPADKQQQ